MEHSIVGGGVFVVPQNLKQKQCSFRLCWPCRSPNTLSYYLNSCWMGCWTMGSDSKTVRTCCLSQYPQTSSMCLYYCGM